MLDFGFYNMDCMEGMREFPDKFFDLAIVDPPYGLERFKHGGSVINKYGSEKGSWNNTKPKKEYFTELFRVSKNQIIWGGNNFDLPSSEYFIIWDKINPENFSFAQCEMAWTSCKVPAKIFRYNSMKEHKQRIHPTQKPVALYKWLLDRYMTEGGCMLDTHVGSASSLIACREMGFKYVGFEIDPDYYREAKKRLDQAENQVNIFDLL
jgi:site-specific DNA-methyltransferase (adenine-specific)